VNADWLFIMNEGNRMYQKLYRVLDAILNRFYRHKMASCLSLWYVLRVSEDSANLLSSSPVEL